MKVSIITIAFNSEASIEHTIQSVLNQSYKDIEYIIVDGASKDGTLEIVKKYEPLFEGRLFWSSERDKGIYDAMNKGIRKSTGELIGIVNSDDWLENNAVEKIVELANKTPGYEMSILCGSLKFHYQDGTEQLMESNEVRFHLGMKKDSLNYGAYHPSMFVGKEVYNTLGLFDDHLRVIADTDFISRCYKAGIKFVFTKAVINNMSDGGASNSMNLKKRIPDMVYSCKKNGYGPIRTSIKTSLYFLKLVTKSVLGESLMRRLRARNVK